MTEINSEQDNLHPDQHKGTRNRKPFAPVALSGGDRIADALEAEGAPASKSGIWAGVITDLLMDMAGKGELDKLPLIRSMPLPVPVGHPEHPDFRGYDDDPVPDAVFDYEGDLDAVIEEVASGCAYIAWGKRG